jgi:hypothetical protein
MLNLMATEKSNSAQQHSSILALRQARKYLSDDLVHHIGATSMATVLKSGNFHENARFN